MKENKTIIKQSCKTCSHYYLQRKVCNWYPNDEQFVSGIVEIPMHVLDEINDIQIHKDETDGADCPAYWERCT